MGTPSRSGGTALREPQPEQPPPEGAVSTADVSALDPTLKLPSAHRDGTVVLENGVRIEDATTNMGGETSEPRQPEDEPQILEIVHETESESSECEVELVLVNGELVQAQPTVGVVGGEHEQEQEQEQEREQEREQEQEYEQERVVTADPEERLHSHENQYQKPRHGAGPYAIVELPGDEELMRTVVAHTSQLVLALRKRPVWETIAKACGLSRFVNGVTAQLRVQWLQSVWRDPSHRMHAHLTDELRDLLNQYKQARENEPTVAVLQRARAAEGVVEPPTKRFRRSQREPQHDQDALVEAVDEEDTSTALEEPAMEIVLKYAPQLVTAERKLAVWDAIARDCHHNHTDNESNGSRIKSRTAWLCKVLLTPTHAKHKTLSPRLRQLLRQFLAFDPWTKSRNGSTHILTLEDEDDGSPDVANPARSTPTRRRGHAWNPWKTVQAPMDELLMALVLEKRPFALDGQKKQGTWAEITRALKTPQITSGMGCQARVRWLLFVYENPTHDEHDELTLALRESLATYLEAYAPFQADTSYAKQRRALQADGSMRGEMTPNCGAESEEEEEDERSEQDDEEEEHEDDDTGTDARNDSAATTRENAALLREILRVRPFHAKQGRSAAQWDVVAAQLQCELGSTTVIPTGLACLYRMKRLLRVVRRPKRHSTRVLPRIQVEMLTLIDRLLHTNWPTTRTKWVTDRHRALAVEIEDMLRKARPAHDEEDDPDEEDDTGYPGRRGDAAGEGAAHSDVPSLRVRVGLRRRLPPLPVVTPPPVHNHKPNRSSELQLLDGDEDDAAMVEMELNDDPRASLAVQIQTLQSEVATCRAQLTLQGSKSQYERQEHRTELRAMMGLLVSEQETQKNETQAMLATLQQEQRDRRDEFTAMLKMVTQSK